MHAVKNKVDPLSFPYSLAKELEADALDDNERKKGVSKVKFYVVDSTTADMFPVWIFFLFALSAQYIATFHISSNFLSNLNPQIRNMNLSTNSTNPLKCHADQAKPQGRLAILCCS